MRGAFLLGIVGDLRVNNSRAERACVPEARATTAAAAGDYLRNTVIKQTLLMRHARALAAGVMPGLRDNRRHTLSESHRGGRCDERAERARERGFERGWPTGEGVGAGMRYYHIQT